MAAVSASPMFDDSTFDVDKLSYEIFSILENNFLFGYDEPKLSVSKTTQQMKCSKQVNGKVRILSIDGGGATDGILAGKALAHLENFLRRKSGNSKAHISDYFDVVAGSGAGGILAALLFTRGKDGNPMFSADESLDFLVENRRRIFLPSAGGILRRCFRASKVEKLLRKTFGECTLKDTVKPVLIPCYDLSTCAPFLFSRADALEMDGYDFKIRDVCLATSANPTVTGAVEMKSVDQKTKITAVDGGIAMNNPTAAAITHVLNNKQEFPFCNGVEDLVVVSLGNGESDLGIGSNQNLLPSAFVKIAGDGASDMVDQAVSMAFTQRGTSNYARIQTNGIISTKQGSLQRAMKSNNKTEILSKIEEMLSEKTYQSVLFQGKKMVESTNLDKLELFSGELIKEEERRKTSSLPTVVLKHTIPTPRTSSATTLSTLSSSS
ncbi:Patatin [Melia azedarach]|uniref:Patatin n=1 Tax=Melia azedarach TaxID=155640 RepID=A0ACC1WV88_MELAZ|nr:Patatin [Melia azedarach]